MFKYKSINLQLLGLTLFTSAGFYNVNSASAKFPLINDDGVSSSIQIISSLQKPQERLLETESSVDRSSSKLLHNFEQGQYSLTNSSNPQDSSRLLVSSNIEEDAAFDWNNFEGFSTNSGSGITKTLRTISLSLFLLFFVPFGIFYPFFLLYTKLLNNRKNHDNVINELEESNDRSGFKPPVSTSNPENLRQRDLSDRAVVSQLQIASVVKDDSLKQKLIELCSSVDSRTDQGIAELMRETISLLINEDEWTHVSCHSELFATDRIRNEFEAVCIKEQNKLVREKLSVVGGDTKVAKPVRSDNQDLIRHLVVTLVFCTSHSEPLFEEIRTKNQLREKLAELAKIPQDELIKFDLLWNPQSEVQYLTNNELLKNYIDMTRLF